MTRTYKLAANFNTVEFTITHDDLLEVVNYETESTFDECEQLVINVDDNELIKRVLQREYDILASINVINIAPDIKQAKKIDPPSEKQVNLAKQLGMKDPEKHDKKEVWQYIQDNIKK